jgi:hypothetical protein
VIRRAPARWLARSRTLGERWRTLRGQWHVERELEQAIDGNGPIIAGPWCSEVGYEVLYWVPFLRRVLAAYRIPPERVIALSRGGADVWYRGIAARYADALDFVEPEALAARARAGDLKQKRASDFDRQLVDRAAEALGVRGARVLHPSLMFRWFEPFWSGHETMSFLERHTRYQRMDAGNAAVPCPLPPEYVAVKFYAARSLPDRPEVRAQLRALTARLSERWPVVYLDTGLGLDDHSDFSLPAGRGGVSLHGRLDARTNLAAQTRVIAGARLFVGTCGSLAWLAPLLGAPTVALFTDDSFLHAHLHVARRVYARTDAAAFSALDLSGLMQAGLDLAAPGAMARVTAS